MRNFNDLAIYSDYLKSISRFYEADLISKFFDFENFGELETSFVEYFPSFLKTGIGIPWANVVWSNNGEQICFTKGSRIFENIDRSDYSYRFNLPITSDFLIARTGCGIGNYVHQAWEVERKRPLTGFELGHGCGLGGYCLGPLKNFGTGHGWTSYGSRA